MLATSKPSFANDVMYRGDGIGEYGIASCYNALKLEVEVIRFHVYVYIMWLQKQKTR